MVAFLGEGIYYWYLSTTKGGELEDNWGFYFPYIMRIVWLLRGVQADVSWTFFHGHLVLPR